MHICILVTTRGRLEDFERLLVSLTLQSYLDFSVLIGNQNPPGVLEALLSRYADRLSLRVHSIPPCSLSAARNHLLANLPPLEEGDYIALADDDCYYAPDALANLARYAAAFPAAGAMVGAGFSNIAEMIARVAGASESGLSTCTHEADITIEAKNLKASEVEDCPELKALAEFAKNIDTTEKLQPAKLLSRYAVFSKAPSWCIFIKHGVVTIAGNFDENMGIGAPTQWQSGEETDYLLRLLQSGQPVYRASSIHIFHEAQNLHNINSLKIKSYGMGRMYLLHKHKLPLWFKLMNVAYPLFAMVYEYPRLGYDAARGRIEMFKGRWQGLFAARRLG